MKIFLAKMVAHRIKEVTGIENIPKQGPAIIVSNHVGEQDGPLLYSLILRHTGQMPYSIAKWKILSGKFCRRFLHTIPIYKDRSKTLAYSSALLKKNKFIVIFPEGGVNLTEDITKIKTGAIRLAIMNRVPIIPVGLVRMNRTPKYEIHHTMDILCGTLKISINSPIYLDSWYNADINRKTLMDINRLVMSQVARLANKRYIG